MAIISKKKIIFKVTKILKNYLTSTERAANFPLTYSDLLKYEEILPVTDEQQDESLWETVVYSEEHTPKIHKDLIINYALLKTGGDISVMNHLEIDRIDVFISGETKPFRIKVINRFNKNFDFFYIKIADASRIYGLEFEHFLSVNQINYLVDKDSILEEHIAGIPGELFINKHLKGTDINKVRLLKEFIKFNERCFIRLLGDMHPGNFVIALTPDIEDKAYHIRAIDFDQQSYEGKKLIYQPKNFNRNKPFMELGENYPTPETILQYQKEERASIAKKVRTSHNQIKKLTQVMVKDTTSFPENINILKEQLSEHYKDKEFLTCKNMGEILVISLKQLFKKF
jgi:hypothetical protein